MVIALDPANTRFTYVLESDRDLPESEQTRWFFRKLTVAEFKRFTREANKVDDKDTVGQMELNRRVFECGIVGWENLRDKDGVEVEFPGLDGGRMSEDVVDRVLPYIHELAGGLFRACMVARADIKNS